MWIVIFSVLMYASCTYNVIHTCTVGSKDQVTTDPSTDNEPELEIPISGLKDG